VAIVTVGLGLVGDVLARGTYDKTTGLFSLSYTYANLPNGSFDANTLLDAEVPRTPELDALVAQFYQGVSDDLGKVTNGKGFLAPPQYTDDIRKADVIISPGQPFTIGGVPRGGWGTLNGFTANSGQLAIYIESLKQGQYSTSQQRLTVVHELCHYLFGLPDEYNSSSCPLPGSPSGLGCLMDNYNTRTWPGKLCNDTPDFKHNPSAVAGSPTVNDASKSCQAIVDDFFVKLGLDKNARFNSPLGGTSMSGSTASGTGTMGGDLALKVQDKARSLINQQRQQGKTPIKSRLLNQLKSFADELLQSSGAKNSLDLRSIATLALESVGLPPIVPKILIGLEPLFEAEAKRLAQSLANKPGRGQAILKGLRDFARSNSTVLAAAPPADQTTTDGDEIYDYLKSLATKAAAENSSQVIDPTKVQYQYFNMLAARLDAILIANNVPGAVDSRIETRAFETALGKAGLLNLDTRNDPFRKARATLVIAPPITSPDAQGDNMDLIYVHPGDLANYNDLRYECIDRFNNLIDRARVQTFFATSTLDDREATVKTSMIRDYGTTVQEDKKYGSNLKGTGATLKAYRDLEIRKRKARISDLLDLIYGEIRKDTIQNVVLLVPPNGLPLELVSKLEKLRPLIIGKTDLRLDIVQVGAAPIPRQLRDYASRSDGTVFTVTDQDEVGAISQRLANDQSQGTWINLPLQGTIHFQDRDKFQEVKPIPGAELNQTLFQRMLIDRVNYPIGAVAETDPLGLGVRNKELPDEIRLALRPFYVDAASDYQFVLGLSTGLNVPSADCEIGNQDVDLLTPKIALVSKRINVKDASEREPLERTVNRPIVETAAPNLAFNPEKSSTNLLVFDLPQKASRGVSEGWYTPVLILHRANFEIRANREKKIPADAILKKARDAVKKQAEALAAIAPKTEPVDSSLHFTFSIGTSRSNALLIPQLIQPPDPNPDASYLGTLSMDAREAIVQVQMIVGAPVKKAKVAGYYQRIERGVSPIQFQEFALNDEGQTPDKVKDDGIYSGRIDLVNVPRRSAEYRVVFSAEHQDGTAFIDLAESMPTSLPSRNTDQATQVAQASQNNPAKNLPVPKFQRATSLNFYVAGEVNDARVTSNEAVGAAPPASRTQAILASNVVQVPTADDSITDADDAIKKAQTELFKAHKERARLARDQAQKDYDARSQMAEMARKQALAEAESMLKAEADVTKAEAELRIATAAAARAKTDADNSKSKAEKFANTLEVAKPEEATEDARAEAKTLADRAAQDQQAQDAAERRILDAQYALDLARATVKRMTTYLERNKARYQKVDQDRLDARTELAKKMLAYRVLPPIDPSDPPTQGTSAAPDDPVEKLLDSIRDQMQKLAEEYRRRVAETAQADLKNQKAEQDLKDLDPNATAEVKAARKEAVTDAASKLKAMKEAETAALKKLLDQGSLNFRLLEPPPSTTGTAPATSTTPKPSATGKTTQATEPAPTHLEVFEKASTTAPAPADETQTTPTKVTPSQQKPTTRTAKQASLIVD